MAALTPAFAGGTAPSVLYGITAVRLEGSQVSEVMMGMVDPSLEHWDLRPAPTRLVEVVDRLVEGDTVVTSGQMKLHNGSPVTIDNSVQPTSDAAPKPTDR